MESLFLKIPVNKKQVYKFYLVSPSVHLRLVLSDVREEEDGVRRDPHLATLVRDGVHHELRTPLSHHAVLRLLHWDSVFLTDIQEKYTCCKNYYTCTCTIMYCMLSCNVICKSSFYLVHFSSEALFFSFRIDWTRADDRDVNVVVSLFYPQSFEVSLLRHEFPVPHFDQIYRMFLLILLSPEEQILKPHTPLPLEFLIHKHTAD